MTHDPKAEGMEDHSLSKKVTPFASDQLHSASYLADYMKYLDRPYRRTTRQQVAFDKHGPPQERLTPFLYRYTIGDTKLGPPRSYGDVNTFLKDTTNPRSDHDQHELLFLTGSPSPRWLAAVVERYGVDHRLLHRHLDFLPCGQRDSYTTRDLPSRSQGSFRLYIPSIMFIGQEGRHVKIEEIQKARQVTLEHLRSKHKAFFSASAAMPGQSIVRHVNIHTGDAIVIEQAVTVSFVRLRSKVKVLVWTDAGHDQTTEYIPVPSTESFRHVAHSVEFCPVFFDTELRDVTPPNPSDPHASNIRQPFSILSSRYGETMNWSSVKNDPALVLEELFRFQAAASMQYLRMLRQKITQLMAQSPLTDRGFLNMEDILHFDYTKSVLLRWTAHFCDVVDILRLDLPNETVTGIVEDEKRKRMIDNLIRDFDYLQREAKTLIDLCDNGKLTILSSHALSESRRTAQENQILTAFTKATTRLTFIFLPVSFVTSAFGMNFKQFGQGTISIWLWVAVTVPLFIVSVILVEWGPQAKSYAAKWIKDTASKGSLR